MHAAVRGSVTPVTPIPIKKKCFPMTILTNLYENPQDNSEENIAFQMVHHKPESLDDLCRRSKFSRKELQIMYRGFKQECPTGMVDREAFISIYETFFPHGDPTLYAHFVFNAVDKSQSGVVSFESFIMTLSMLARGNLEEKLEWAFSLYDINHDGVISRDDMLATVSAIYDMLGVYTDPIVDDKSAANHVERIFKKLDRDGDGVISHDEFMTSCLQDDDVVSSMMIFDTLL